jgi:hypothetical protein
MLLPVNVSKTLELALQMDQRGQGPQGLAICERVLTELPQAALAYHIKGLILCRQGRLREGLTSLNQAVRIEPQNAEFLNNLGAVLGQTGRFDDAASCIHAALQVDPNFGLGHFNLAVNFERQAELQKAERSFRQAVTLLRQGHYAQYRLACVLHRMKRFEESEDCLLDLFEPARGADFIPVDLPKLESPGVVVVVTCKGRLTHLRQTLPQLLSFDITADYRVVVVDYDDPDRSFEWCAEQRHPRLVAIRVADNAKVFNLSRARNCGANALPSDILCFVDADAIVDRQFLEVATGLVRCAGGILSRRIMTHSFDTAGVCCVRTTAFRAERGYDESLQGYGPEDLDFYSRVRRHASISKFEGWVYPKSIPHGRAARTRFYELQDTHQNIEQMVAQISQKNRSVNPTTYGQSNALWAAAETNYQTQHRTLGPS